MTSLQKKKKRGSGEERDMALRRTQEERSMKREVVPVGVEGPGMQTDSEYAEREAWKSR